MRNGPRSDMDFTDLDDSGALGALDSEDVLGAVEGFAEQCRQAWDIGTSVTDLPSPDDLDSVVVLGMGGSGVSGDVVATVVEPGFPLPFRVIKSYGPLPAWVGPRTLVFAVSYSGSTEETLASVAEANERGARLVAISSGGPLQDMAATLGATHVAIPSGLQPRASLGFLTLPVLAVLAGMGLVTGVAEQVTEAIAVLEDLAGRCHRSQPVAKNPAKALAVELQGKVPIVYGGYGFTATAAMRFKCDLNEYGKSPAYWNYFPELNHNEIVGWSGLRDITAENMTIVLLRDPDEHERIALRFEITKRLIAEAAADVIELHPEGASPLARLLSLIFVTQLASIYVGLAHGVDPGPVDVIEKLKAELAATKP